MYSRYFLTPSSNPVKDLRYPARRNAEISASVKLWYASAKPVGEIDVLNPAAAVPIDNQAGNIVKTPAFAGADVENTAHLLVLHEPQVNGYHVIDMNEIPALLSVVITAAALEQFHVAVILQLPVQLQDHAGHSSLVPFTGTVNIEIPQAGNL